MATYSSHRLIMGKVEIDFFSVSMESSLFHVTFVQIGIFDWLSGRQKGPIFVKMFKNLLRNHIEDEAETWHTCVGHYPLQKLCFTSVR